VVDAVRHGDIAIRRVSVQSSRRAHSLGVGTYTRPRAGGILLLASILEQLYIDGDDEDASVWDTLRGLPDETLSALLLAVAADRREVLGLRALDAQERLNGRLRRALAYWREKHRAQYVARREAEDEAGVEERKARQRERSAAQRERQRAKREQERAERERRRRSRTVSSTSGG
jgi:hypothetical protein